MALAKQAQPNLNTRFAKHVLVTTSDVIDPDDTSFPGGWRTNAAGHAFNQNYGFGLIDAGEFSLEATRYAGVTSLKTESTGRMNVGAALPDNDATGVTRNFELDGTTPLEEVLVTLNASHSFRGDLQAFLRSPSGTESRLLLRQPATKAKTSTGRSCPTHSGAKTPAERGN